MGPGSGTTVSSAKDSKKKRKLPKFEDLLQGRDFTGALTLLEVSKLSFIAISLEDVHDNMIVLLSKNRC